MSRLVSGLMGRRVVPKSNYTATTNPTVNDDVSLGYSSGSIWVNTSTPAAFICITAADGAADWNQIG